ncbi:MAG: glycosyltransferase [Burkholderiales bacterium]
MILGKGPSFSRRGDFDLTAYNILALNDAARIQPVDVAHAIDLQVIERSGEALSANARYIVMPWRPHVNLRPSESTLEQISEENKLLKRLKEEGRLLWYNLSSAASHRPNSQVVEARYFSAEAGVNLLATSGVRTIRTLGIDGGKNYSASFADLNSKSLLANGRSSFDRQFEEFARTILKTGVDLAPLDIESPIRIYVATTEAQMLAVKVLEYSIKKHASMSASVFPLNLSNIEIPEPKEIKNKARTPFSFQRFLIPELANRKGRAIYLDSDMLIFRDIKHLWTLPMGDSDLLAVREATGTVRRPQFSVMLLDCEKLDWNINRIVGALDDGSMAYEDLMYSMCVARKISAGIDPAWNSLESFSERHTALLHYTDMDTQPWISPDNPLGYLWFRDLFGAIACGFISKDYVEDHIAKGYVRPSIRYQMEHGIEDSLLLPRHARTMDKAFVPAYVDITNRPSPSFRTLLRKVRALARAKYHSSGVYRLERKVRNRLSM